MGSSIFTGSGIKIYSNFGIRDKKIRSKNGISLKKIYLATTLNHPEFLNQARSRGQAAVSRELGGISLPTDVLWGLFLFVTHSFRSVGRNECVTNKNKPHRTSAGRVAESDCP